MFYNTLCLSVHLLVSLSVSAPPPHTPFFMATEDPKRRGWEENSLKPYKDLFEASQNKEPIKYKNI